MQPLNDDMDELFRRAADEYPLNTNGADWNKVLQELQHTEANVAAEKKKKDYRFLWLLLLLPIGFMIGRYIGNNNKRINAKGNKEVNRTVAPQGTTNPGNTSPGITGIQSTGNNKQPVTAVVEGKDASNKNADNSSGNPAADRSIRSTSHGNASANTRGNNKPNKATNLIATSTQADASVTNVTRRDEGRKIVDARKNNVDNSFSINPVKSGEKKTIDSDKNDAGKNSSAIGEVATARSEPVKADTTLVINNSKRVQGQMQESKNSNENKKVKTLQSNLKSRFSYSLLAGPDLSTVKLQRTSRLGFSFGLMLGYKMSSKLAVEAGVLWDRKNYYTDGKYLDTTRLKLPRNSIVKTAEGYCNMIEIPVNVRYAFITKQNYSWFISAGLSSYLMKQEEYSLTYSRYNQPYSKDYGYTSSTKDWFSIMNLSVGYQTSLKRNTNISIAPYVKLPLRGVGIGKLPVSSTGVYISVSRFIK